MNVAAPPVLTAGRQRTLGAVVERILPGVHGLGAVEVGAAAAVESAMRHQAMRGLRPGLDQVLDHLDAQARERHAREFPECTPAEQDELLHALEREPNPWLRFVFRTLIVFSLEGLLGDPVHGGNRDFRGWQAIGLRANDVRSGLCRQARGC